MLDESDGFPWARWFVGGKLNIVRNCVDRHAAGERADHVAVEWASEGGERRSVTYAELDREVCRAANAMRAAGVSPGDTIGLYMPMVPELVTVFYAALKIGAVVIPVFSGFGAQALATRLEDGGLPARSSPPTARSAAASASRPSRRPTARSSPPPASRRSSSSTASAPRRARRAASRS